jgi:hypothetical protein
VELPEPAPWIAELPQDSRGFFVLSEAGWEGGKPVFSKFSVERTFVLAMNRACALCGHLMPEGTSVYRGFAQVDAAHIRMYEREHCHDLAGPLHLSCILYSAIVCPYLREKTARLSKMSAINPGSKRGTRAAVMGFSNLGVMMAMRASSATPKIAYIGLVEDLPYREGDELRERYAAAVQTDSEIIDLTNQRLFWSDSDADTAALTSALTKGAKKLRSRAPVYGPTMMVDGVDSNIPFMTMPV